MAFGPRRKTVTTLVGDVPVGSEHPVVVQSMTNTDTADVAATVEQVAALAAAGSQIVRITVNNEEAAAAVPHITERLSALGIDVPIVGDFHYNGHLLLAKYPATARSLAKYRINPGNVGGKRRDEHFRTIVRIAIDNAPRANRRQLGLPRPGPFDVNDGRDAARPNPLDAKDVYIEAMLGARCVLPHSRRKRDSATTGS